MTDDAVVAVITLEEIQETGMWADAERDSRPAEYRWRPLLNATKFIADERQQRVPGTGSCSWKRQRSPRVRRRVAWNNQCRRDSRAQATAGTAAGCQMQGLGEVPWRCTMKASESHNIEPKLYPVRNSQPMEFTE